MMKLKKITMAGWFFLFQLICMYSFGQNKPVNQLNNLQLQALDGKGFQSATLNKKLLALVFLSPECPLSANYSLQLNKLRDTFKNELDIVGIFPGKSYSGQQQQLFRDKYNIQFYLRTDTNKQLVKALSATVTPEIFLLDQQRKIVYRGAIDNWAVCLGKQRVTATQHFFKNAIEDYLRGMPVAVKQTQPVGCLINDF